jgi:cytochrome c peroxidase
VDTAYDQIAQSIAAFERTELFAPFTSKFDAYLQACMDLGGDPDDCANGIGDEAAAAGGAILTAQEWAGLLLWVGDNNNDGIPDPGEGALCSACHPSDWREAQPGDHVPDWSPDGRVPGVFTDFSFDNLGVPRNPENPFYDLPLWFNPDGDDFVDVGLGGALKNAGYSQEVYEPEMGKMKVMGLRNIGITGPYMHNGFFDTLLEVVHFYNTRDVPAEMWPPPEVAENVNTDELGNLALSPEDEAAVVAFMETLTDGYTGD